LVRKPIAPGKASFVKADAVTLEGMPSGCNAAFAGFWWSHMKKATVAQFVANLAQRLAPAEPLAPPLAAILVVLGHVYPVWLGFRGGKGVATGLGAFAVLEPVAALVALPVFLLVVATTQFASLGSVLGALSLAVLAFIFRGADAVAFAAAATAALIVFRHRANMRRILDGTERRLGTRGEARP
jgi:glycerol-3-phosphate acyltransferase PlsY